MYNLMETRISRNLGHPKNTNEDKFTFVKEEKKDVF